MSKDLHITISKKKFFSFLGALFLIAQALPSEGFAAILFQDDIFHEIVSPSIILDADNDSSGVVTRIISNQGSDSDGEIRYNSTNGWQMSNNDGPFFDVVTTGYVIPSTQARRTTSLSIGTSFADVTFDTTDIETDSSKVDHNNGGADRILIQEDGTYLVSYNTVVSLSSILLLGASMDIRVRINDSSVIDGSASAASIPLNVGTFSQSLNRSVMVELNSGDYLTVQMSRGGNSATLQSDALFSVQRIGGL